MSAIRVARGFTGRDKVVKFRGCYHGHSDGLLVKAGSGALTQSVPDSKGVPADYTKNTLVAEYNQPDSVQKLFETQGKEIAAIIVEPVAANMGVVLPEPGFLEFLRKITEDYGALLIFDEVITGFRLGIGGGMPVGAYGGRKEIMDMVAPVGPVYQAGTLSGNPIATTAGIETLTILKETPEIYTQIEASARTLAEGMRGHFGESVCVNQIGSLMSIFFTAQKVKDYETATSSDISRYADYFNYMLDHQIYLAPSQFEAMFVSAAHTAEDIAQTCEVLRGYGR